MLNDADIANFSKPIIVVGAGITGLLIAQGLKKANIPCVVFEKETEEGRPRDWSMSLHWSYPMLRDLLTDDLMAKFRSTQTDPFYDTPEDDVLPICNAETGEPIAAVPLHYNYRVSRGKLRKLCKIDVDIRYGKRLQDITMPEDNLTVEAQFEDGTTFIGSALVGTDGAKSVVRKILLGEEVSAATPVPFEAWVANGRYSAEDARDFRRVHPIYTMGIHPSGYFCWLSTQDVIDPNDPETWEFMIMISRQQTQRLSGIPEADNSIAEVKQLIAQCCAPFLSAWAKLPDTEKIWHIPLSCWDPVPWDNRRGCVTLGGDAAHTMTFHRGQGLNHAINDAWSYVASAKKYNTNQKDLATAITEYDVELRQRGGEEVRASLQNTRMIHSWQDCRNSPLFTRGLAIVATQAPATNSPVDVHTLMS